MLTLPDSVFCDLWIAALSASELMELTDYVFDIRWTKLLYPNPTEEQEWNYDILVSDEQYQIIINYCAKLLEAAHMSVREIKEASGMTMLHFATRFCVPLRTVESWCAVSGNSQRTCPDYLRLQFLLDLGIISRNISLEQEQ